eukprot:COSAG06_NODE_19842_length_820_cov_0.993065_1_plen_59_part_10
MRSFYQDRLGTNIRKPQKKTRFLRDSRAWVGEESSFDATKASTPVAQPLVRNIEGAEAL